MSYVSEINEIVRKKWRSVGKGWKVGLILLVVVGLIVGLVITIIWFLARLVKSISAGGFRNMDLYFPRRGR